MIVPDANLLIYAYDQEAPQHKAARNWWETLLSEDEPVGVPWLVALAFLRIATHPTINRNPMAPAGVMAILKSWEDRACFRYLHPGPRHREILESLVRKAGVSGNRLNDAHIVALAIEHDACIHSSDQDFARFPEVRWLNPLIGKRGD